MKVIMLKDVGGVGRRGAIVDVKDGYALNFLIPHGAAEQATPQKLATHAARQEEQQAQSAKQEAMLRATIRDINGTRLHFKVRATEKGGLFRSLAAGDIAKELRKERGIELTEGAIVLAQPIKQLGDHEIIIRALGAEARVTASVEAA